MGARRLFRPRSFLGLVLLGFSLVALPLFLALFQARTHVERLERRGTAALFHAVSSTQASRALAEHLVSLERKTRQFAVLGDEASRNAYTEEDTGVRETLGRLKQILLADNLKLDLDALAAALDVLSAAVASSAQDARKATVGFDAMHRHARALVAHSNQLVLAEATVLESITRDAKRALAWQALAAVPAAIAFALLFTLLISRPVRQIDQALKRLGSGDFSFEITVGGAGDLEALGKRIDWLRNRLLELQGEKARFLARASHDLKTPLTAVRESADLLLEEAVGPLAPPQLEVARILRDNSLRLQRSIQGLLDHSVAEARTSLPAAAARLVPLRALVDEVLADQRPAAAKKKLTLRAEGPEVEAVGDPEQLRVALDNLVSNAVKFTPAAGLVEVAVSCFGTAARIDVRDTGPGLAPGEEERVFEDFFQGKVSSSGPIRGSGLGLSIAREHIERYGGKVEALTSPRGAHFQITLRTEEKGGPP